MKKGIMFKVGDKVLLDGTNLKTTQPKAKLSDKQHGPLLVTDYSHVTKPGTTARTKGENIRVRKTRLGQVYKRDRN